MCFTFLAAQGHEVGKCLLEADQIDTCRGYLDRAAEPGVEIVLPTDVVVADRVRRRRRDARRVVPADAIPADQIGLDIGPESVAAFAAALADARTVFWNGPMGVFEIAAVRRRHPGRGRGAGRDRRAVAWSAAATRPRPSAQLGLRRGRVRPHLDRRRRRLEYLEGKTLPGVAVLED